MTTKNRIFISFAIEDETYRDFLVGQARNEHSPFNFVNMSVKEPWSESWKTQCRTSGRSLTLGTHRSAPLAPRSRPELMLWPAECSIPTCFAGASSPMAIRSPPRLPDCCRCC